MPSKETNDILKSLTPEQKAVYDTMLADENKLFADWSGCRKMYTDAMKVINDPEIGPKVRLFLNGIAHYWSGRKNLMEKLLVAMDKEYLLNKWIEDAKKQART